MDLLVISLLFLLIVYCVLTLVVPYIVSLFSTIYICPLFKPFFLLWSLLKCLLLLRSLVWPLLPGSTLVILCVMSILTAVLISPLFYFFGSTKVYWLRSTILSLC